MSSSDAPHLPERKSSYGYIPTEGVCILFLVLFGISTVLHIGQAIRFRMWWLLPTACLCGVGELVGWTGRLWSSFSPKDGNPYMMQITTTIIAPTPLIAVNFILLGRIVRRLGPCYSRITPEWYTRIFLTCDIIALIVQGAGGGIAASSKKVSGTELGGHIMLGGILFQFFAIIAYSVCASDFLHHYNKETPVRRSTFDAYRGVMDQRLKVMIGALSFSTLVLFIRSIYRIIELADGWTGRIITTEVYFNVLDGGMIVLAIYTMNFAHPGFLLGPESAERADRERIMMKQLPASDSQENMVMMA